jgi:hypothetical protein
MIPPTFLLMYLWYEVYEGCSAGDALIARLLYFFTCIVNLCITPKLMRISALNTAESLYFGLVTKSAICLAMVLLFVQQFCYR